MAERARGAAPELDRLFRAFRSGDETSLAELVTRTTPWLNAVARRAGARGAEIEEVVQDAWIEASSPMAIPPRSVPLLVWLASIVQHRLLHLRRHQGRRSRLHLVDAAAVDRAVAPSGRTDVVAQARGREVVNLVHQALEGLEPTYRDVLYLNLFEGLSPSAVSQQLGIGRVVVRVRLLRGLRKLRSRLPDALALLLLATLTRNGRSQAAAQPTARCAGAVAAGDADAKRPLAGAAVARRRRCCDGRDWRQPRTGGGRPAARAGGHVRDGCYAIGRFARSDRHRRRTRPAVA